MSFNLNKSQKADVNLLKSNIDEMINIYGVNCNFIYTEKMNKDFVLKDFSHFESSQNMEIYLLPEDTENWGDDLQWNSFGLMNMRTMVFFMSSKTYENIENMIKFENQNPENITIVNSLLIMPNKTILEITDISYDVPGGNNLFILPDDKSAYRITTKVYSNNLQDNIEIEDDPSTTEKVTKTINDGLLDIEFNEDEISKETFEDLDTYFQSLDEKTIQDSEGQKISNSDSVFGSLG